MSRTITTPRRLLASLSATILVVLSVVVPMLDAGWATHDPVLESEHDTHCVPGHDHTICSQATTSRALPSRPAEARPDQAVGWRITATVADLLHPRDPARGHHSRAPPFVRA